MKITSVNPANDQAINTYELINDDKVGDKINAAEEAFQHWKSTSFKERSILMQNASAVLLKNKEKYAEIITMEMGKTITSAQAEIEKCAQLCTFYAEKAEIFLADELIETEAAKSFVTYCPMGVLLAVMPWNYPFWQVFRFAVPALMAGNTALLKHASNVPHCGILIQEVFETAGFPKGVFINLLISSKQVDKVIENRIIKAVSLTGSEKAGSAVASVAGKNLKKTVLELGGSDAYIILEDADLDHAATACAESRLLNSGQSCIGAKRFVVVKSIYAAFMEKFRIKMQEPSMDNPTMPGKILAPMARKDPRDELHKQVRESVVMGAKIALGGFVPDREGAFYPATILTDVKPGMPAYQQELFGPVAAVILAKNEADAIRIANDTDYGLGSCIFTQDLIRGEQIARNEIEAGSCFVNHYVKSDQRLPFGGIKNSGFGRELSSFGIKEFMNTKTVSIA